MASNPYIYNTNNPRSRQPNFPQSDMLIQSEMINRHKDSVISINSIYPEPLFLRDKNEDQLLSSFQQRGSL
jgi:hypothetical protein